MRAIRALAQHGRAELRGHRDRPPMRVVIGRPLRPAHGEPEAPATLPWPSLRHARSVHPDDRVAYIRAPAVAVTAPPPRVAGSACASARSPVTWRGSWSRCRGAARGQGQRTAAPRRTRPRHRQFARVPMLCVPSAGAREGTAGAGRGGRPESSGRSRRRCPLPCRFPDLPLRLLCCGSHPSPTTRGAAPCTPWPSLGVQACVVVGGPPDPRCLPML